MVWRCRPVRSSRWRSLLGSQSTRRIAFALGSPGPTKPVQPWLQPGSMCSWWWPTACCCPSPCWTSPGGVASICMRHCCPVGAAPPPFSGPWPQVMQRLEFVSCKWRRGSTPGRSGRPIGSRLRRTTRWPAFMTGWPAWARKPCLNGFACAPSWPGRQVLSPTRAAAMRPRSPPRIGRPSWRNLPSGWPVRSVHSIRAQDPPCRGKG